MERHQSGPATALPDLTLVAAAIRYKIHSVETLSRLVLIGAHFGGVC